MKILTSNDVRFLGFKLLRGLIIGVAVVAGVVFVFSVGSYAGELFGKVLKLFE